MSYSRWDRDSRWYTYWCAQPQETENRDTSLFTICGLTVFTAKELRDDIDGCLNKAIEDENKDCDLKVTEEQSKHLKHCMERFLLGVDRSYPKEKGGIK